MTRQLKRILMIAGLFVQVTFPGILLHANEPKAGREYYQIIVYHFKSDEQERAIDGYLQQAFIPAMHRSGIAKLGVFKPMTNDTTVDKLVYVFVPMQSFAQLLALPASLEKDAAYKTAGAAYLDAVYNNPPYTRMESIWLYAFPMAPKWNVPALKGPHNERVFELRSYESPTEKLHVNKVHMFNEGGEVPLFKRLGFNAVFYADVINGSHMPNLMYMTSFENMAARQEHWKSFNEDAEWKKLVAQPQYAHNVSRAEVILMHATEYSDF